MEKEYKFDRMELNMKESGNSINQMVHKEK